MINGDPANIGGFIFERKAEALTGGLKDVDSDIHDFWADPVSGEYCKFQRLHVGERIGKNGKSALPGKRFKTFYKRCR